MPSKFLDEANTFAFPVLHYAEKKSVGEKWLTCIFFLLSLATILNAWIFEFIIPENEIQFKVLSVTIIILKRFKGLTYKLKIVQVSRLIYTVSNLFPTLFIIVPLSYEVQEKNTNWKALGGLSRINGFNGNTLLIAPEISFPMGINMNMELLSPSELQSVLYVSEST